MSNEIDLLFVCRRYVQSRDEVARLKAERHACICDFQGSYTEEIEPTRKRKDGSRDPCWRFIPGESDEYDRQITKDSRLADNTEEGWCEPCKRRQEIHRQIAPAQRRKSARLGALIAMTRGIR